MRWTSELRDWLLNCFHSKTANRESFCKRAITVKSTQRIEWFRQSNGIFYSSLQLSVVWQIGIANEIAQVRKIELVFCSFVCLSSRHSSNKSSRFKSLNDLKDVVPIEYLPKVLCNLNSDSRNGSAKLRLRLLCSAHAVEIHHCTNILNSP